MLRAEEASAPRALLHNEASGRALFWMTAWLRETVAGKVGCCALKVTVKFYYGQIHIASVLLAPPPRAVPKII
jgi:hypothetical protein